MSIITLEIRLLAALSPHVCPAVDPSCPGLEHVKALECDWRGFGPRSVIALVVPHEKTQIKIIMPTIQKSVPGPDPTNSVIHSDQFNESSASELSLD